MSFKFIKFIFFDVVLNYTKIRRRGNFIRSNNKIIMVKADEVDENI